MKDVDGVPPYSTAVVQYLQNKRRMTLKAIGDLIGVTESFVSRVANGQRSFTLHHLAAVEEALGESLSVLPLEATRETQMTARQTRMLDEAIELLRGLYEVRRDLGPEKAPRKRRAVAHH